MNSNRKSIVIVVFVMLVLQSLVISGEWIEIAHTNGKYDGSHDLLLDRSAVLENIYSRKDLRYEDLQEVIGPGFEDDFARFLEAQTSNVSDGPLLAFDGSEFSDGDDADELHSDDDLAEHDDADLESTSAAPQQTNESNRKGHKYVNETLTSAASSSQRRIGSSKPPDTGAKSDTTDKMIDVDLANTGATTNNQTSSHGKKKILVLKVVNVKTFENPFSFSAVMKFLRSIQESLMADAAGTIKSKIESLETFRSQLMLNIRKYGYAVHSKYIPAPGVFLNFSLKTGERLTALWPTKVERSKRDLFGHGHSHGHSVSFASLEVSLITIAFLTFAVFLIKLVLVRLIVIRDSYSILLTQMLLFFYSVASDPYNKEQELRDQWIRHLFGKSTPENCR